MSISLIKDNGSLTLGGNYNTVGIEEIHIGVSAPTKDNYVVWINPEGELPDEVATKGYVDEQLKDIDVDLTGYATESFVAEAIATIELTPGPKGEQGEPGKDGVNGVDGYSPIKGVDYYTTEDKTAIVNDVLAALPAAEEVSV